MTPAEALAERTHALRAEYAPWLDREASRSALAEHGLPEPRCEAWRYSNPNRWYETQRGDAPSGGGTPTAVGARLVEFGAADDDTRALIREHLHTATDRAKHPLATVNDIAMQLGLLFHVPASDAPAEIDSVIGSSQLLFFGSTPDGIDPTGFGVRVAGSYVPEVDGPHEVTMVAAGGVRMTVTTTDDAGESTTVVVVDDPDAALEEN